jgi:P27 family predicted phage terminase small subunit
VALGRPVVPIEQKRRRGTLHPGREEERSGGITRIPIAGVVLSEVSPPASLNELGRREWDYVITTCPWLGRSDLTAVRLYCETLMRRQDFQDALDSDSLMLMTSTGYSYINPAAVGLRQMEEDLRKWMGLLGLTPSDRTRIGVAEVQAKSTLERLAELKSAKVQKIIESEAGLPDTTPPSPPRQSRRATATSSSRSSTTTGGSRRTPSPVRQALPSTSEDGSED